MDKLATWTFTDVDISCWETGARFQQWLEKAGDEWDNAIVLMACIVAAQALLRTTRPGETRKRIVNAAWQCLDGEGLSIPSNLASAMRPYIDIPDAAVPMVVDGQPHAVPVVDVEPVSEAEDSHLG